MSNGYGYGGSSGSSSSRNTTSQRTTRLTPDAQNAQANQARVAPPGYHYMPNGSLMSDAEHARLFGGDDGPSVGAEINKCWECRPGPSGRSGCRHTSTMQGSRGAGCQTLAQCFVNCNPEPYDPSGGSKIPGVVDDGSLKLIDQRIFSGFSIPDYNQFEQQAEEVKVLLAKKFRTSENASKTIKSFDIDYSDIKSSGETRVFVITADQGAEFRLEVKNEDGHYYNFFTNSFSSTVSSLERVLESGTFTGSINFPKITDNDQYDIFLYAVGNTNHAGYTQAKFEDGSLDLNNSIGSTSILVQKVLYQYVDLTLTLSTFSPNSTIETGSQSNTTITTSRNLPNPSVSFSVACSVSTATKSYQIIKQPLDQDVLGYLSLTVGSAPENLPGENIYPLKRADFTGDDVNGAVTSGSVVRMDAVDLSAVIEVGDKITATTSTDTVDGAVTSGIKVVMDNNVASKMAVGDRITGNAALDATIVTVAALNPDTDNVKEFSMSEAIAISDGVTLTFSSKVNRSLTTVTVVETSGTATDFTMSQAIQFRDNQPLIFTPQVNHQWPVDNIVGLKEGAKLLTDTNVTASSSIAKYEDSVTILENTEQEEKIVKNKADALITKNQKPTITGGLITTQPGNIVFDKQQSLALSGDTIKIGSYGSSGVFDLYGYQVKFTDLSIALTTVTTTTTAAVNSSTSVPVASRNGMVDSVSTISGIGINPYVATPTISSGAGSVSGAGTIVLSAEQTLENGAVLTVGNTGQTATITGNIEILKSGTANQTIYFDVENLISIT